MIFVKSGREIDLMRKAGRVTAEARKLAGSMVKPGVMTADIDKAVKTFIISKGAVPTFLGYGGFPKSVCISINEEIIHGIPGRRRLKEGDVVCIDVGATLNGYVGDCAATFVAGKVKSDNVAKLIRVTRESFFEGIKNAVPGKHVADIGIAVQNYVESNGFSVIREYVGHGVGREMHEEPEIPNFYVPEMGRGARFVRGMTIAVEPMVAMGRCDVRVLHDGWTVVTKDRSITAHYENSILITNGAPEILTVCDGETYEY